MCCHSVLDGRMDDSDGLDWSRRSVGQGEVPTSSATGRWSGWVCGSLSTKWINQQHPCGAQKGARRVTASFGQTGAMGGSVSVVLPSPGSPFPQSSSFPPISPVSLSPQGESVSSLGCTEGESGALPTHPIRAAGRRAVSAAPGAQSAACPLLSPSQAASRVLHDTPGSGPGLPHTLDRQDNRGPRAEGSAISCGRAGLMLWPPASRKFSFYCPEASQCPFLFLFSWLCCCGILIPSQGSNLCPVRWKPRVLATGPQGSPPVLLCNVRPAFCPPQQSLEVDFLSVCGGR